MTFINVKFGGGWQVPERGLGFPTVYRERGAVSAIISPIHGTCFCGFVMGTKVTQNILLSNSPNWANLFSLSKNPELISTYYRLKTKGIPACGWYETPQSFSAWQNRRCLKFRHLQHKYVISYTSSWQLNTSYFSIKMAEEHQFGNIKQDKDNNKCQVPMLELSYPQNTDFFSYVSTALIGPGPPRFVEVSRSHTHSRD